MRVAAVQLNSNAEKPRDRAAAAPPERAAAPGRRPPRTRAERGPEVDP